MTPKIDNALIDRILSMPCHAETQKTFQQALHLHSMLIALKFEESQKPGAVDLDIMKEMFDQQETIVALAFFMLLNFNGFRKTLVDDNGFSVKMDREFVHKFLDACLVRCEEKYKNGECDSYGNTINA